MDLLLKELKWSHGAAQITSDIRVEDSSIVEIGPNLNPKPPERVISFPGHYLYPGLINSHDHLEMNLYPKLGSSHYNNYIEWASEIYKPDQSPVREIQQVDIEDRLIWGGLKNLISGVTTVVHHNPWHRSMDKKIFPVKVLKNFAWSHSLAFAKKIKSDFPRTQNTPFIIHAAEGVDETAKKEISQLEEWGLLKPNTVLVHGIALDDININTIMRNRASLVWCPASNYFMFKQTSPIDKIKGLIKVALGSDSTMTGSPTLLDELKEAAQTGMADVHQLFAMVTKSPSAMFNLPEPVINTGSVADFFIAPAKHSDYYENLLGIQAADIKMVVINGQVRLSEDEYGFLKHPIIIGGENRFTDINIRELKKRIRRKVGDPILNQNPLWKLID